MSTAGMVDALQVDDLVQKATLTGRDYPVGVVRSVSGESDTSKTVSVGWESSDRWVVPSTWEASQLVKVGSLHPPGTVVYLTQHTSDGRNGITAYEDDQWPLRGVVQSTPGLPTSPSMDRGYTVLLDDGALVFTTQRMIESAHPGQAPEKTDPDPDPDPEIERLGAEVRRLQDQINRMNAWKETLVSDAHEYANDNNLCEAFDEFMEQHGLPTREADYTVEVYFTVRASLSVSARNEDEALSQAESEALSLRSGIDYHIERNEDSLTAVDTEFDRTGDAERND